MYFVLSLILFTASALILFYLSLRSYAIKSDESMVNLCPTGSESWNCDLALTSAFSEVFGIPISLFGIAISLFCVLILVLLRFNFLEKTISWSRWIWRVALTSAAASIVMLLISWFLLKSFCLLCMICYGLYFLVLFPLQKTLTSTQLIDFKILISWRKWKEHLGVAIRAIAIILFITFFLHAWSSNIYSIKNTSSQSTFNFQDWKNQKAVQIEEKIPRVSYGPQKTPLIITEFADFLCPHCKRVYSVIKTFQQARPNTRLEYINFPLDPRGCRLSDSSKVTSASCYLSKAVLCAYEQDFSASLKDFIFSHQKFFISKRNQVETIEEKILQHVSQTQVDEGLFKKCTHSVSVGQKVAEQIKEGQRLGIQGTPTLFINQKKVRPISLYMTLEKIYQSTSSKL